MYIEQIKWRPTVAKKVYPATYYGSQQTENIPSQLNALAEVAPQYIDLTAGGAQYPFHLARNFQRRVGCNDRNHYAAVSHRVTFEQFEDEQGVDMDTWAEEWFGKIHPDNSKRHEGILCSKELGTRRWPGNREMSEYLDGLCYHYDDRVKATVARTLVSNFTFRSLDWHGTTVDGKVIKDMSPVTAWIMLCRNMWMHRLSRKILQESGAPVGQSVQGDCLENLRSGKLKVYPDAVVYTDPAWPWDPKYLTTDNPYKFFTEGVGSVVIQEHVRMPSLWKASEDDLIIKDVIDWGNAAFEKGAKYFVVSTQSTNWPPPDLLFQKLAAEWVQDWAGASDAIGRARNSKFQELFGIYERK